MLRAWVMTHESWHDYPHPLLLWHAACLGHESWHDYPRPLLLMACLCACLQIGEGGYGAVYSGKFYGTDVAIKVGD